MPNIPSHIDDVVTNLESSAIWQFLNFVANVAFAYGLIYLRRAGIASSKFKVIGLMLAALLLLLSVGSAFHSHGRSGFFYGALFATNCFVALSLVLVIAYPFIRKCFPSGIKKLDWSTHYPTGENYKWKTHCEFPQNSAGIERSSKGLDFRTQSDNRGQRWANMEVEFDQAQDFREWVGISFDLRCGKLYPETDISIQIITSNDSRYFAKRVVLKRKQKITFLFQEMEQGNWPGQVPQNYFDLQQAQRVAVICYTTCNDVEFSVSNFKLIKTSDIIS